MSRPLRDMLATPSDEAVRRTWRAIRDRRDGSPRRSPWRAPVAVGAIAALAVVIVELWPRAPEPLAVVGGDAVGGALATGSAARAIDLSDGSRLDLAPETQLVVRENAGGQVKLALERGRADISVRPGGPRRWSIDCGVATVDVTGTQFVIDRTPERVAISVGHGEVRVSSARLVPPIVYLAGGQTLSVPITHVAIADVQRTVVELAPAQAVAPEPPAPPPTSAAPTEPAPAPPASAPPRAPIDRGPTVAPAERRAPAAPTPIEPRPTIPAPTNAAPPPRIGSGDARPDVSGGPRATPPANIAAGTDRRDAAAVPAPVAPPPSPPDWRALATKGDYRGAFAALGGDGIARETAAATAPDQLVAVADVARLSGHAAAAVAPLRRAAELDAVAGYSLGRLLLDELHDANGAAAALEAAIARGLPTSLGELAHARVVEAHARAGHRDAVAQWAATYEQRYPTGAHREEVRRWAHAR